MEEAKRNPSDGSIMAQALRFNQLFWTILQADITDPANQLPNELKANIMSLSIFVDKQTTKALRSAKTDDLESLIAINRNLAMGLREGQADQTLPSSAPVSPPPSGGSAVV